MNIKADELFKNLRQAAEEIAAGESRLDFVTQNTNIQQLIHELHVYQIELEIQNEELRKTQQDLEISRDRFSYLYHQAPVGYLILDASSSIVQTNQTFIDMIGSEDEYLADIPFTKLIILEDQPFFIARYKAFFKNPAGKNFEIRLKASDEVLYVKMQGRKILWNQSGKEDSYEQLLISISDITAQKQAESDLKAVNRHLEKRSDELAGLLTCTQAVLEYGPFETSARRIFDAACAAIGAISGYVALLSDDGAGNEVLFLESGGLPCTVDPDLPMPIRGLRAEAYKTGNVVYDNDFASSRWMAYMPDGHVQLDNVLFAPLTVEGRVIGLIGLANKPTPFTQEDAKLAEAFGQFAAIALRNSRTLEAIEAEKNRLSTTLLSISDGVITTDHNSLVVLMNQTAEDLTGWTQETASGQPIDHIFRCRHADSKQACENPVSLVIRTGREAVPLEHGQLDSGTRQKLNITYSASPIFDHAHHLIGTVLVFRDITEKLKLESRLIEAQKMESISVLAGGIAHDFNNLLNIILGNTELALDEVPDASLMRQNLKDVHTAGLRGRDVVRQLLDFTAKMEPERKSLNLNAVLEQSITLIRRIMPPDIDLEIKPAKAPVYVKGSHVQLNQMFMNLFTNAFQAMDNGGKLAISLSSVEVKTPPQKNPGASPHLPGAYAKITIQDTGHGISSEIMDKIFDPYFTTRPVGKGSGLGLAAVHGIVKSHNGWITVDSIVHHETIFRVFLPILAHEIQQTAYAPQKIPTGNERILFVDDEPTITRMAEMMLKRIGYTITTYNNPLTALNHVRTEPNAFDLVITDMTMLPMNGDELAREIMTVRKDLPIIICTGFSEKMDARKARAMGIKKYIEKPVSQKELAMSIREVLDQSLSEK